MLTCLPLFLPRTRQRNDTLWASWAVQSSTGGKVWFGGDTGYRSVARDAVSEDGPTCPVFAEIGQREGPFDVGMIPIGAYQPRWIMSPVHCSPEDSVELHQHVRSKKSFGMHWATWRLTSEEVNSCAHLTAVLHSESDLYYSRNR
jgi:N-acyl-phosphatidylethanolamine-hydrolysing phospholipase D